MTYAETREQIRRAIERQAPAETAEIAAATDYEESTVSEHCRELREAGRIVTRPNPWDPRVWLHEPASPEAEVSEA